MSNYNLIQITSIDELRAAAADWDDLWWRSEVTMPAARAELLAQWVEQFAPQAGFRAVIVEDRGTWVAALPLVSGRVGRVLSAGTIPANAWVQRGGLLSDADADLDSALAFLVAAIRQLPYQLLWLDEVPFDTAQWRTFRRAIGRAGFACDLLERYQVPVVKLDGDWEKCQMRWSKKHRSNLRRRSRELAKAGKVRLKMLSRLHVEEVETWLRRGFEIEDASWKGSAGSSVLRRGMFPFFVRQAKQLAKWGQLEVVFLECGERPIAFCYGCSAKGVFHASKIAYEEAYAACAPGYLMLYHMLELFHSDPARRSLDLLGEINRWARSWRPVTYPIGQLAIAPRRLLGRVSLHAYQRCWPLVRRLRQRFQPSQSTHTSAATV